MELLERASQLEMLASALEQAKTAQGCIALVYGEAGIGKTSLVEHFVKANSHAWRILRGACDSLFTPRPLGPLHDVALQTQGPLLQLIDSQSNGMAIFSACLNELGEKATLLVIEDVHWADEATLDLLKYLGRRIQRTNSMVILTYRDDETGVDHPLRILLGDLASSHATYRIPVAPLSNDAVHELAGDKNVDLDKLHRLTSGNPFFVTEVLAGEGGIPETVRDAVLARAARLSPSAREALEAAAVIGSKIEPWLLAEAAEGESTEVDACFASGMLQTQGEFYSFRHELTRETIFETISPQRKMALHHKIMTSLKEMPETKNDLVRLANHAEGTKDAEAILAYAPAAAEQAANANSHREAVKLYKLALRFSDRLPPARHAQLLEACAAELRFTNRANDRLDVLQQAINLWHLVGDNLREGAIMVSLAAELCLLDRFAEAEETNQDAIHLLESLPPGRELARAYRSQCFIRMMNRDCEEAVAWGNRAISLAERFEDFETLARAYNYAGCALLLLDHGRGQAFMEKSLAIGRHANLPYTYAGTLNNLGWMLVETYRFEESERYLTEGIAYAVEHDDDYHQLGMQIWRATGCLHLGRWTEAEMILSKVMQFPQSDMETRTCALITSGRLHVRRGDAGSSSILNEAMGLSEKAGVIQRMGPLRAARAEKAWLAGDSDRILEEAFAVYEFAVEKEHPWIAGELAFWCWKAGKNVDPPKWIAAPFAHQIEGAWQKAAKEWEELGCPYEQGMALMDGDETAQHKALEIFESLGARPIIEKLKGQMTSQGISVPRGPRTATRENPFGLTPREMEVLRYLVNGSSNGTIAEGLSLSIRTVEHHIASILRKMDVGSRSEAATLALKDNLFPSE